MFCRVNLKTKLLYR